MKKSWTNESKTGFGCQTMDRTLRECIQVLESSLEYRDLSYRLNKTCTGETTLTVSPDKAAGLLGVPFDPLFITITSTGLCYLHIVFRPVDVIDLKSPDTQDIDPQLLHNVLHKLSGQAGYGFCPGLQDKDFPEGLNLNSVQVPQASVKHVQTDYEFCPGLQDIDFPEGSNLKTQGVQVLQAPVKRVQANHGFCLGLQDKDFPHGLDLKIHGIKVHQAPVRRLQAETCPVFFQTRPESHVSRTFDVQLCSSCSKVLSDVCASFKLREKYPSSVSNCVSSVSDPPVSRMNSAQEVDKDGTSVEKCDFVQPRDVDHKKDCSAGGRKKCDDTTENRADSRGNGGNITDGVGDKDSDVNNSYTVDKCYESKRLCDISSNTNESKPVESSSSSLLYPPMSEDKLDIQHESCNSDNLDELTHTHEEKRTSCSSSDQDKCKLTRVDLDIISKADHSPPCYSDGGYSIGSTSETNTTHNDDNLPLCNSGEGCNTGSIPTTINTTSSISSGENMSTVTSPEASTLVPQPSVMSLSVSASFRPSSQLGLGCPVSSPQASSKPCMTGRSLPMLAMDPERSLSPGGSPAQLVIDEDADPEKLSAAAVEPDLKRPCYRCEICLESFDTCSTFQSHKAAHHFPDDNSSDPTKDDISPHGDVLNKSQYEKEKASQTLCFEESSNVLTNKGGFERNVKRTKTSQVRFCRLCGQKLGEKRNLLDHLQRYTGCRVIVCHDCRVRFSSKNLAVHVKGHMGSLPYVCAVCSRIYSRQNGLMDRFHKIGQKLPLRLSRKTSHKKLKAPKQNFRELTHKLSSPKVTLSSLCCTSAQNRNTSPLPKLVPSACTQFEVLPSTLCTSVSHTNSETAVLVNINGKAKSEIDKEQSDTRSERSKYSVQTDSDVNSLQREAKSEINSQGEASETIIKHTKFQPQTSPEQLNADSLKDPLFECRGDLKSVGTSNETKVTQTDLENREVKREVEHVANVNCPVTLVERLNSPIQVTKHVPIMLHSQSPLATAREQMTSHDPAGKNCVDDKLVSCHSVQSVLSSSTHVSQDHVVSSGSRKDGLMHNGFHSISDVHASSDSAMDTTPCQPDNPSASSSITDSTRSNCHSNDGETNLSARERQLEKKERELKNRELFISRQAQFFQQIFKGMQEKALSENGRCSGSKASAGNKLTVKQAMAVYLALSKLDASNRPGQKHPVFKQVAPKPAASPHLTSVSYINTRMPNKLSNPPDVTSGNASGEDVKMDMAHVKGSPSILKNPAVKSSHVSATGSHLKYTVSTNSASSSVSTWSDSDSNADSSSHCPLASTCKPQSQYNAQTVGPTPTLHKSAPSSSETAQEGVNYLQEMMRLTSKMPANARKFLPDSNTYDTKSQSRRSSGDSSTGAVSHTTQPSPTTLTYDGFVSYYQKQSEDTPAPVRQKSKSTYMSGGTMREQSSLLVAKVPADEIERLLSLTMDTNSGGVSREESTLSRSSLPALMPSAFHETRSEPSQRDTTTFPIPLASFTPYSENGANNTCSPLTVHSPVLTNSSLGPVPRLVPAPVASRDSAVPDPESDQSSGPIDLTTSSFNNALSTRTCQDIERTGQISSGQDHSLQQHNTVSQRFDSPAPLGPKDFSMQSIFHLEMKNESEATGSLNNDSTSKLKSIKRAQPQDNSNHAGISNLAKHAVKRVCRDRSSEKKSRQKKRKHSIPTQSQSPSGEHLHSSSPVDLSPHDVSSPKDMVVSQHIQATLRSKLDQKERASNSVHACEGSKSPAWHDSSSVRSNPVSPFVTPLSVPSAHGVSGLMTANRVVSSSPDGVSISHRIKSIEELSPAYRIHTISPLQTFTVLSGEPRLNGLSPVQLTNGKHQHQDNTSKHPVNHDTYMSDSKSQWSAGAVDFTTRSWQSDTSFVPDTSHGSNVVTSLPVMTHLLNRPTPLPPVAHKSNSASEPRTRQKIDLATCQNMSHQGMNLASHQNMSPQVLNLATHQDMSPQGLSLVTHQNTSPQGLNLATHQDMSPQGLSLATCRNMSSHGLNLTPYQNMSPHASIASSSPTGSDASSVVSPSLVRPQGNTWSSPPHVILPGVLSRPSTITHVPREETKVRIPDSDSAYTMVIPHIESQLKTPDNNTAHAMVISRKDSQLRMLDNDTAHTMVMPHPEPKLRTPNSDTAHAIVSPRKHSQFKTCDNNTSHTMVTLHKPKLQLSSPTSQREASPSRVKQESSTNGDEGRGDRGMEHHLAMWLQEQNQKQEQILTMLRERRRQQLEGHNRR